MKIRRSFSGESERFDINISPLIDMVFILLIFFIVTTVFVDERGITVNKPTAGAQSALDQESIVFVLTTGGQVLHDGRSLDPGGVTATVRRLTRQRRLPVIIDVRSGALTGLVVRVMDEARLAEADSISLTRGK
jgi:biopolymer transport protein ExbD